MTNYILWSTRQGGWLSRGGNYTSEYKDAERFEHVAALTRCKIHVNGTSQFGLIPVSEEDLEALR